MDLYEHQGKELFARHGIPVPRGIVVDSAGVPHLIVALKSSSTTWSLRDIRC